MALGAWVSVSVIVGLLLGRMASLMRSPHEKLLDDGPGLAASLPAASIWPTGRQRILLVDDDPGLRLLLRTTLAADEYAIEEAGSAEEGAELARFWRPAVVVLDVNLPGTNGLAFCRELKKRSGGFDSPHVVLLTGGETSSEEARAAGADVLLRKPFSPLDLMGAIDSALHPEVVLPTGSEAGSDQLLAYARDLRETIQAERAQRRLLQQAYRQTISTLTDALEAKSRATGHHGLRVQRYAVELTEAVEPRLLDDPSLEYGFLLHDIGKIGIPEAILEKRGALEADERRVMQQHPLIGAELLAGVPMLDGEGLQVVRSHHERWDGEGYPDGLVGAEIPPAARIFAVADTLDAMTTDRPYRRRCTWDQAVDEILRESGRQFDPRVVAAFATRAQRLRRTQQELAKSA
ncbi:MAG TPA: HD domain-containing phosphohydrolase [Gaiellaceae bacterium]|nr:HD domain-containing phosphohydrolase [Gaiellaceae bacterium]